MAEQQPPKEKLVGDLETLVTLLEEGKDPTPDLFANEPIPEPETPEPERPEPVAQQPVSQERVAQAQAPASQDIKADMPVQSGPPAANQDLFDTLLGSGWEAQSNALLHAASATIQTQKLDWNPGDTEALTAALRVRLEQSINGWLHTTLAEQVALLHQQLLQDLQEELSHRVQSTLHSNQQQRQQKEDGLSQLAEDPAAPSSTDR